ncbi:hypothetical protein [Aquimarina aggregata]|nr:hypothetical protein [Aquimarina aggregata]
MNTELSDNFNDEEIDIDKWFVEGNNGDCYIQKGRTSSQFVPHDVRP